MKRTSWILGAVVVGAALVVGCSDSKSEPKGSMTVQGSVSSGLNTDNARAVAIGANGKQVWTYLDKHGDFSLKLPLGQSYRVLIANQRAGKGQNVVGRLTVPNGAGKTRWIGANEVGTVNLGVLRPETAQPTTNVKCFCGEDGDGYADEGKGSAKGDDGFGDKEPAPAKTGTDGKDGWGTDGKDGDKGSVDKDGKGGWGDAADDDADHGDDNECFEGKGKKVWTDEEDDSEADGKDLGGIGEDDDEICDVCSEGEAVDLQPSKKPDASKLEDKGKNADDGDFIEKKACPKKSASTKGDPGSAKKEPSTDDKATDKGADKGTDGKVVDGKDDSSASDDKVVESKIALAKKLGDKCSVKSECSSDCSCVASKCAVK